MIFSAKPSPFHEFLVSGLENWAVERYHDPLYRTKVSVLSSTYKLKLKFKPRGRPLSSGCGPLDRARRCDQFEWSHALPTRTFRLRQFWSGWLARRRGTVHLNILCGWNLGGPLLAPTRRGHCVQERGRVEQSSRASSATRRGSVDAEIQPSGEVHKMKESVSGTL